MFGAWRFESSWTVGGLGARGITYLVCLIELHGLLVLGLPPFSACGSSISAGSCWLIEQGPFYSEIRIMRGYLLGTLFVLWLLVFCESSLAKVPSQRHVICKGAACAYQLSDSSSASRRPLHHDSQTTSGGLARPINFFFFWKLGRLSWDPQQHATSQICFISPWYYIMARHHPFNQISPWYLSIVSSTSYNFACFMSHGSCLLLPPSSGKDNVIVHLEHTVSQKPSSRRECFSFLSFVSFDMVRIDDRLISQNNNKAVLIWFATQY